MLLVPWSDDSEVVHHRHVFVFEVAAVEDVFAAVPLELDEDVDVAAPVCVDSVLPAMVIGPVLLSSLVAA